MLLVALESKHGDIFQPEFFNALRHITDDVFYLPSVDRTHVSSLYTPDTRFNEIVEGGFAGGPVIPNTFKPDAAGFALVKANIYKAGILGRLVGNNFRSAVVSAKLNDFDPHTGARLDYAKICPAIERDRPAEIRHRGHGSACAGLRAGDRGYRAGRAGDRHLLRHFAGRGGGVALSGVAFAVSHHRRALLLCHRRHVAARHHYGTRIRYRSYFRAHPFS